MNKTLVAIAIAIVVAIIAFGTVTMVSNEIGEIQSMDQQGVDVAVMEAVFECQLSDSDDVKTSVWGHRLIQVEKENRLVGVVLADTCEAVIWWGR